MNKTNFNEEHREHWKRSIDKAPKGYVKILQSLVGENKSVLDVGCGTGEYTRLFIKSNTVIGIDIYPKKKQKGFRYIRADAETFEINKKFNVIVLNNVIEHILDQKKTMVNCRKHLKDSGHIVISTPNPAFLLRRFNFLFGKPLQEYNDEHIHMLTVSEMKRLCKDTGLRITRIIPILSFLCSVFGESMGKLRPSLLASNIIYVVKKFNGD